MNSADDHTGAKTDEGGGTDGAFGGDEAFEALLVHLRDHRGFDFTGYKRASLRRRIQRRMAQIGVGDYTDYVDVLQVDSDEFSALFNTILINVTGYFRDPDTWSYLRDTALPALIETRPPGSPLRLWSAGCANGAEAYSLAIVLAELLGIEEFRRRVKIYATDVDEDALATARHATYTERELDGLPPELRKRYFDNHAGRPRFRADLRRTVIFGRNDLVQDAPISRIDVLACRNTLMYLTPHTQSAVLSRFLFALNPAGILVLGKAEMMLNNTGGFETVELSRRIFRKIPGASAPANLAIAAFPMERRSEVGPLDGLRQRALDTVPVAQIVLTSDDITAVINRQAEKLFGISSRDVGRPLRDLVLSYRPVELRAAIEQARLDRAVQHLGEVSFVPADDRQTLWLDVNVIPLIDDADQLLGTAITYRDVSLANRLSTDLEQANVALANAYEELQATGEELETTNEELQSTVEELETTNEELQSTNEELETTNEELQSTNDELQRINAAADERSNEADRLNTFLESILASLRSAVIALDTDMRVTVWNDHAEDLWGLRRDEVLGEHLFNLDIGLPVEQLRPAIRATQDTKATTTGDPTGQHFTVVNRRGRTVGIRVMATALHTNGRLSGTILLIE